MQTKTKPIQWPLLFSIFLVILIGSPAFGTQADPSHFDVIVSINRLEETLNLIDNLVVSDPQKSMESPTTILRLMVQGTNWIDTSRLIIIGVKLEDPQPKAAILIPFKTTNKNFQSIYKPMTGPDYYVLSLPPKQPQPITKNEINALLAASLAKVNESLYIKFNPHSLLAKNEPQIQQFLTLLDNMPQTLEQQKTGFSGRDLKQFVVSLLSKAGQLDFLGLGLDLTAEKFSSTFLLQAVSKSELADLFRQPCRTAYLQNYRPEHHSNVRSCSYDVSALMKFIDNVFGQLYQQLGFDFSEIARISTKFSGEMVAGISYAENETNFEMILVMAAADTSGEFIQKEYLPWLMRFGQNLTALLEKEKGQKLDPIFVRTKDSLILGQKVMGIKTRFPYVPAAGKILEYEVRMTSVERFLLTASDDRRLRKLIRVAKKLKQKPALGPLMAFDMDLSKYFEMLPSSLDVPVTLPRLGRVSSEISMENGRLASSMRINTEDIKNLITFYKQMESGRPLAPIEPKTKKTSAAEKKVAEKVLEARPEKTETEEDASYWVKKGALLATYGNDSAAIKHFQKALQLDPDQSDAHFHIGISYGEIGNYEKALFHLNKAIAIKPHKDVYYYGRGRVYLLADQREKARADLKTAAAKGNKDAQNYLDTFAKAPSDGN